MSSFAANIANRLMVTAEKSDDTAKVVQSFAAFLKERNLLWVMPAVLRHLKNKQSIVSAQQSLVITAKHQPDQAIIDQIKATLQTPTDVKVIFHQDDKVLSGLEVRFGGKAYVATAESRLTQLTKLLQTSKN